MTLSHDSKSQPDTSLRLRAGDWVEVRSAKEILATLDSRQSLSGLVFMPEMLRFCGRRMRVFKVAHKTCDTIQHYAIRRMVNTVHLSEARCDGAAHAGCEAGCLLFWKEAWLKRAAPEPELTVEEESDKSEGAGRDRDVDYATLLEGATLPGSEGDGPLRYRCQATDLLAASTEVRRRGRWNPLLYIDDVFSRNVSFSDFLWFGLAAAFNAFTLRWFERRHPYMRGRAGKQTPAVDLSLQPGELVQVKSRQEILQTVNGKLLNRGLSFDVEMAPYCGGTYRVLRRVSRMIDERTGRLLVLSNPSLILDGVTCSGYRSSNRMFCPRNLYPFWREAWLTASPHRAGRGREAE